MLHWYKLVHKGVRWSAFLALLGLAGCLDMPHPFRDPGPQGRALSRPPPARLAIVASDRSLLPVAARPLWIKDMSEALLQQSVPAVTKTPQPGDWRLETRAREKMGEIVPTYSLITAAGKIRGTHEGAHVPAEAWKSGDPHTLKVLAQEGAVGVASLLSGVAADEMDKDPHSLKHRAARVYFKGVTGAPGDGNTALARQFFMSFQDKKNVLQNTSEGADFSVKCVVKVTPVSRNETHTPKDRVEIIWTVQDKDGKEAGKVAQLNDVPGHSLDKFWGDTAAMAAQQAAGGVRQVITNNSGRNNIPLPEKGKSLDPHN